ncbi:GGDEF domain-containing protein [uncultured Clostridium sp.]|uniref:GGDEF domain-containing protein n=1 Tax=uncultured Clostridium sp. TaxID=59620 RepID=UPI0025ED7DF9|nr:GGDEF domain-containing protein [uncultured Clostridium sp.]
MKKIIFTIILLILTFITNFSPLQKAYAKSNVINVGFSDVKGFSQFIDGKYTGYLYEYLMEISKFTGWKYNFIECTPDEITTKLLNGEIDLAGAMLKNDITETLFDFPEYDIGASYYTLSVLKNNTTIVETDYETLNNITVGVVEGSSAINKFYEFCDNNNIKNVNIIEYDKNSDNILHTALKNKEIDAILAKDLLASKDERVVTKFSSRPYYLATTKGNDSIIKELNYSISQIRQISPSYSITLYNKYFHLEESYHLALTQDEIEFLSGIKKIKAVYVDNFVPIQNWSSKNKKPEGISIDVSNIISEKLNIDIDLEAVSSFEEALNLIKENKTDILIGIPNNYSFMNEYNLYMTKSYISAPIFKIENKLTVNTAESDKILALPKNYLYDLDISIDSIDDNNITYYNNVGECIDAVNKGTADYTYGDLYSVESNTRQKYYKNISVIYKNNLTNDICIALSNNTDVLLLRIINKIISSISAEDLNTIIYQNTLYSKTKITLQSFIYSNYLQVMIFVVLILVTTSLTTYIIMKIRLQNKNKQNSILKEKSEKDALTGIFNRGTCKDLISNYLKNKDKDLYCAFFIIDIDNFKGVNDNLGHRTGDDVLKDLAENLKHLFRKDDIVGRWGGDEFIVFIKDLSLNNLHIVYRIATDLCNSMDKNIIYNNMSQHISLSIGIAFTKDKVNFNELYQKADEVLYTVKENGKNGFSSNMMNNHIFD